MSPLHGRVEGRGERGTAVHIHCMARRLTCCLLLLLLLLLLSAYVCAMQCWLLCCA